MIFNQLLGNRSARIDRKAELQQPSQAIRSKQAKNKTEQSRIQAFSHSSCLNYPVFGSWHDVPAKQKHYRCIKNKSTVCISHFTNSVERNRALLAAFSNNFSIATQHWLRSASTVDCSWCMMSWLPTSFKSFANAATTLLPRSSQMHSNARAAPCFSSPC